MLQSEFGNEVNGQVNRRADVGGDGDLEGLVGVGDRDESRSASEGRDICSPLKGKALVGGVAVRTVGVHTGVIRGRISKIRILGRPFN